MAVLVIFFAVALPPIRFKSNVWHPTLSRNTPQARMLLQPSNGTQSGLLRSSDHCVIGRVRSTTSSQTQMTIQNRLLVYSANLQYAPDMSPRRALCRPPSPPNTAFHSSRYRGEELLVKSHIFCCEQTHPPCAQRAGRGAASGSVVLRGLRTAACGVSAAAAVGLDVCASSFLL